MKDLPPVKSATLPVTGTANDNTPPAHVTRNLDPEKLDAYFNTIDNVVMGLAKVLNINTLIPDTEETRSIHDIAEDVASAAGMASLIPGEAGTVAKDVETLADQVASMTAQLNANTDSVIDIGNQLLNVKSELNGTKAAG